MATYMIPYVPGMLGEIVRDEKGRGRRVARVQGAFPEIPRMRSLLETRVDAFAPLSDDGSDTSDRSDRSAFKVAPSVACFDVGDRARLVRLIRLVLHSDHGVLEARSSDDEYGAYLESVAARLHSPVRAYACPDFLCVSDFSSLPPVPDAVFVQDVPHDLLTPQERELLASCCDAPSQRVKDRALSYVVSSGNARAMREFETTDAEALKFAVHACHARRANVLAVLLERIEPLPRMFDICVGNADWLSIRALTAARYLPSRSQLYELAHRLTRDDFMKALA